MEKISTVATKKNIIPMNMFYMKCVRPTKTKVLNFTARQKKRCLNLKNNNNHNDIDGKT